MWRQWAKECSSCEFTVDPAIASASGDSKGRWSFSSPAGTKGTRMRTSGGRRIWLAGSKETRRGRVRTRSWDAATYLETEEDMVAYLEAALEEHDAALFATALGDVARARGMARIARDTGLGRESLYKALSPDGNPELATVLKVLQSLGLRLHAGTG